MTTAENALPTIMLVDDTPANLSLLEEILRGRGYRVVAFPRGAMALRAAAANPPDLILLDIMMPEMDGFEVCRRLKADERLGETPVIFISALDDTANMLRAFNSGGVDYVSKPFQESEVLARVAAHLRLRQQQLEIEAQRRRAQESYERLCDLESQRDQLVHMIVHDMRSPLMGILGYAEIIEMELRQAGNGDLLEMAGHLRASGAQLNEMVSTLLDVSRLEAGAMPVNKRQCDLGKLIADALDALKAYSREARIEFHPPNAPVAAICDPDLTRRILQNLVANALKFGGAKSVVCVDLSVTESGVVVAVSDTGDGIPLEYQARVFDKFAQAPGGGSGKAYSTGLGLTFCKLAVEAQGGEIGLKSEIGRGSTFQFNIPSSM
ncbi:MAG: hybrid sensor histidine kinase/response regulator [Candidatus Hydrogenedentes bacterium]|nr:hybrid sensor histidine kinase/response regulator [Candidatus Hydrogenedentota bacterium]